MVHQPECNKKKIPERGSIVNVSSKKVERRISFHVDTQLLCILVKAITPKRPYRVVSVVLHCAWRGGRPLCRETAQKNVKKFLETRETDAFFQC